jgi:hypothetical protein
MSLPPPLLKRHRLTLNNAKVEQAHIEIFNIGGKKAAENLGADENTEY